MSIAVDVLSYKNTVLGVVLNDQASLNIWRAKQEHAPYHSAPKAPVMYIKTANTWAESGVIVKLPTGEKEVELGLTFGIVIAKEASKVQMEYADSYVAGYRMIADLSLVHDEYYRPAIREKCFDNSCVIGRYVPVQSHLDPTQVQMDIEVDGQVITTRTFSDLVRSIPQLLVDVSDFLTLKAGDILLVGVLYQAPLARVGSEVCVRSEAFGEISFSVQQDKEGK